MTKIIDLRTHPEIVVTIAELAAFWKVSEDMIRRDIRKGALKAHYVGTAGEIRIFREDAIAYGPPLAT